MKYCRYCGGQVADEAVVCMHCGRMIEQYAPAQKSSSMNIMCLLGLIFSFIASIVGLVLSIVGYNQVKNTNDTTGKTMAKAGIIISSVAIGLEVLSVFLVIFWTTLFLGALGSML